MAELNSILNKKRKFYDDLNFVKFKNKDKSIQNNDTEFINTKKVLDDLNNPYTPFESINIEKIQIINNYIPTNYMHILPINYYDNTINQSTYINNGLLEGYSSIIFSDNSILSFNLVNGQKHGSAILTLNNDSIILFKYINNLPHGNAKRIYTNGNILIFRYNNGVPSNDNELILPNGDIITFMIKNFIPHGDAFKQFKNGSLMFTFVDGKPNGNAVKLYKNGSKLKFKYQNGNPEGIMILNLSIDNSLIHYQIINKFINGSFIRKDNNGQIFRCKFIDGIAQGKAKYINNECDIDLYLRDGIAQGIAYMKYKNGILEVFNYTNGVKQGSAQQILSDQIINNITYIDNYKVFKKLSFDEQVCIQNLIS